ncbi:hypothetical protein ADUPG1_004009, partial [Aduncisulcus paluster]
MEDYRLRHHNVCDTVVSSLHKISPSLPLLREQYSSTEHRPDIIVDFSPPIYIEITITYADARISSLETATRKKREKYRELDDLIVITLSHDGIYMPSLTR